MMACWVDETWTATLSISGTSAIARLVPKPPVQQLVLKDVSGTGTPEDRSAQYKVEAESFFRCRTACRPT
jgi:hypothetical protein